MAAKPKPDPHAPYLPADYEPADVGAIQALHRGDASPEQARRALRFIIENLAGTYDLSYRPDSDRDTAFAEGKRYVGLQLVKMTHLRLKPAKDSEHD
jgi:hypothetical protein